jgi:hydroxymethylglutaryl-CoA lyase
VGTPGATRDLLAALSPDVDLDRLAVHMHDTFGQGLANTLAALEAGVTVAAAAVGGLGGCPFAPGATGNICTEDLVYLMSECGIETGADLERLCAVARKVEEAVGRPLPGQVMKAGPRLRTSPLDAVATALG